jgi:hypothetical protein
MHYETCAAAGFEPGLLPGPGLGDRSGASNALHINAYRALDGHGEGDEKAGMGDGQLPGRPSYAGTAVPRPAAIALPIDRHVLRLDPQHLPYGRAEHGRAQQESRLVRLAFVAQQPIRLARIQPTPQAWIGLVQGRHPYANRWGHRIVYGHDLRLASPMCPY